MLLGHTLTTTKSLGFLFGLITHLVLLPVVAVVHGVVCDGDPEGVDLQELGGGVADEVRRLRLLAVTQQRLLELPHRPLPDPPEKGGLGKFRCNSFCAYPHVRSSQGC